MSAERDFTDELFGYAVSYLYRHAWRLRPYLEMDDALQEAYILFLRLSDRYPDASPREFMALWKSALHNEVWAWAVDRSKRRQVELDPDMCRELVSHREDPGWERYQEAAPAGVHKLLAAIQKRVRRPRKRRPDGRRLTTNEYLCRFAHVKESENLREELENWLANYPGNGELRRPTSV